MAHARTPYPFPQLLIWLCARAITNRRTKIDCAAIFMRERVCGEKGGEGMKAIIGKRNVFEPKQPDPVVCKRILQKTATMWAIINPDGLILTSTVREKRWESFYAVTHGYHKFPQKWRKIYYNRGYRCVRVNIMPVIR